MTRNMKIGKEAQNQILKDINQILGKRGIEGTAYLFGGSSLISQNIISRTTKDIDLFLFADIKKSEISEEIRKKISAKYGVRVDIGLRGQFEISGKGFTWRLPKSAYKRAVHIHNFSNLKVYALHILDIIVLKSDRIEEKDMRDLNVIFAKHNIARDELVSVFEEYYKLLDGNKASLDNIKENFYQLILTIHAQSWKEG